MEGGERKREGGGKSSESSETKRNLLVREILRCCCCFCFNDAMEGPTRNQKKGGTEKRHLQTGAKAAAKKQKQSWKGKQKGVCVREKGREGERTGEEGRGGPKEKRRSY